MRAIGLLPVVFALLVAVGFADRRAVPDRETARYAAVFPACPGFSVPSQTVSVPRAGGTLSLGDVTLFLPPGAVANDVSVAVARGTLKGGQAAAVRFTPATPVTFQVPVVMRMSYRSCSAAFRGVADVYRVDGGREEKGGGRDRKAAGEGYVDVMLSSLSEYALAIE